jgi:hypothetical protein
VLGELVRGATEDVGEHSSRSLVHAETAAELARVVIADAGLVAGLAGHGTKLGQLVRG